MTKKASETKHTKTQKPVKESKKKFSLSKAILINSVAAALFQALYIYGGDVLTNALGNKGASNTGFVIAILAAIAVTYTSYRVAFWSAESGFFKPEKHAKLTAWMMMVQAVVAFGLGTIDSYLRPTHYAPIVEGKQAQLDLSLGFLLVSGLISMMMYSIVAFVAYTFALKRASRKLEGFDPIESKEPRISTKLRPLMLIYGIFATLGIISSLLILPVSENPSRVTDAITTIVGLPLLVMFWGAYEQKTIGKAALWKLILSACLVTGVVSAAMAIDKDGPAALFGVVFSLPLYIASYWYAFKFMPNARKRELKGIKPEELFK